MHELLQENMWTVYLLHIFVNPVLHIHKHVVEIIKVLDYRLSLNVNLFE